jgi:hypothetical protein
MASAHQIVGRQLWRLVKSFMQMHDPKQVIRTYLLHSSHLGDDIVLPGSIHVLKEQKVDHLIFFIVTYTTQLQVQCYACMQVSLTGSNSWEFSGFQMMGGNLVTDLPQKAPPQIAWTRSVNSDGSSFAIAVLPNEVEVTSIRLREGPRIVCDEQLENRAMFFFISQKLREHIHVELYDHGHTLVGEHLI